MLRPLKIQEPILITVCVIHTEIENKDEGESKSGNSDSHKCASDSSDGRDSENRWL